MANGPQPYPVIYSSNLGALQYQFEGGPLSLPAISAAGVTNGSDAAVGQIGEYHTATFATSGFDNPSEWEDKVSLVLTPGDWEVTLLLANALNGATLVESRMGVSTIAGGTPPTTEGVNWISLPLPTTAHNSSGALPGFRISSALGFTVYFKAWANYSVASPLISGTLSVRRVR